MVMTLSRTSTAWSDANHKGYDVWGSVRSSSGTNSNNPKLRYCANLGHVEDDQSGLIYMRARFYEPWTGRFISQDPAMDGLNWYAYCSNDPIRFIDESGHQYEDLMAGVALLFTIGTLLSKLMEIAVKYLLPIGILIGTLYYAMEATSHLPLGVKVAAAAGSGLLNKFFLSSMTDKLGDFLFELGKQIGLESPKFTYRAMTAGFVSAGAYMISLTIFTLLIGFDA